MHEDPSARDKSGGGNQNYTYSYTYFSCSGQNAQVKRPDPQKEETLTLTRSNVFELEKHFSSEWHGNAERLRATLSDAVPWSMHLGKEARRG